MPEYYLRVKTKNGDEVLGPTQPYPTLEEAMIDLDVFAFDLQEEKEFCKELDVEPFILIETTYIDAREIVSFGLVEIWRGPHGTFTQANTFVMDAGNYRTG